MDKLKSLKSLKSLQSLQYSVSKSENHSNILTRYTWIFYDSNNVLKNLDYQHSIYYVNTLNKETRIREDIEYITEKYIISSFEKKSINEQINDIEDWLINNLEYLTKSHDNCMKSYDIIKYITSELGEYNYALTYEVGWSIKDVYKLYIDLYSTKILLNYKEKESQLSEQTLKKFIEKNKKVILQAKENQHKKYIQRIDETREKKLLEQLTKDTEELRLIETSECDPTRKACNATRKVGSRNKCESFIIKRTLKECYETQSCKPLPVKYPWHI